MNLIKTLEGNCKLTLFYPALELFWVKTRTGQGLSIPVSCFVYLGWLIYQGRGTCQAIPTALCLFLPYDYSLRNPQLFRRSVSEAQAAHIQTEVLCK